MSESIESVIDACRCCDYFDFGAAWAIQKSYGPALKHHEKCSSVPGWHPMSGPGLLCDCGALEAEWKRMRETTEPPK